MAKTWVVGRQLLLDVSLIAYCDGLFEAVLAWLDKLSFRLCRVAVDGGRAEANAEKLIVGPRGDEVVPENASLS